ncbi:hypothetical protein BLNAU_13129 [Blattamonas nauphoetae]|uniref:Uncharacterized protein n=1 Tax=Blattamonas nauphoetae TaxID=2049346 RepID=A0ABQ9XHH2_9EUKA|nr:hypothetical protein BLNAU_13129 [Blattamonas nauphoetae]
MKIVIILLSFINTKIAANYLLTDAFEAVAYAYTGSEWVEGYLELDWAKKAVVFYEDHFSGNGIVATYANFTTGSFVSVHFNESGSCVMCRQEMCPFFPRIKQTFITDRKVLCDEIVNISGRQLLSCKSSDQVTSIFTTPSSPSIPMLFQWHHLRIWISPNIKPLHHLTDDELTPPRECRQNCPLTKQTQVAYGHSPLGLEYTRGVNVTAEAESNVVPVHKLTTPIQQDYKALWDNILHEKMKENKNTDLGPGKMWKWKEPEKAGKGPRTQLRNPQTMLETDMLTQLENKRLPLYEVIANFFVRIFGSVFKRMGWKKGEVDVSIQLEERFGRDQSDRLRRSEVLIEESQWMETRRLSFSEEIQKAKKALSGTYS